jgi:hypothetical protein
MIWAAGLGRSSGFSRVILLPSVPVLVVPSTPRRSVSKEILWNSLCKGTESSNCSGATEMLRSRRL